MTTPISDDHPRELPMSQGWKCCPHCGVYFVPATGTEGMASCPGCATGGWYYAQAKKKVGPVTTVQLKELLASGTLTPTDMVLQPGAQKWTAAGDVREFYPKSIVSPLATTDSVPATCTPKKSTFDSRHDVLSAAQVVPDATICVQCGMCTYNCPMEIDVRAHAWRGIPIRDSHCLTCSECVNRCPRGVLRFERIPLFVLK